MRFTRTEEAAKAELADTWSLLEAIAADAAENDVPIVGRVSVEAAVEATARAGNEKAPSTVNQMCVVAKFDFESTAKQRRVWRRYGWATVLVPANAGWSQEASYELLSGDHKTWREVAAKVRGRTSLSAKAGTQKNLNDAWHTWLNKLGTVMTEGAKLATRTDTEGADALDFHAVGAHVLYQSFTEKQIDAEYRHLVETENAD